MTNLPQGDIPQGYEPHFRKSPVTDAWEPLYSRASEGGLEIGLLLGPAHCNSRSLMHGGVIAALADNAMGLSYAAAYEKVYGERKSPLTVSLNVDYAASAKLGQWVEIAPRIVKAGRSMGFVDALVTADGETIARASATFRVPSS